MIGDESRQVLDATPQQSRGATMKCSVWVVDPNGATEPGASVGRSDLLAETVTAIDPRPVIVPWVPTSGPVDWTVCEPR